MRKLLIGSVLGVLALWVMPVSGEDKCVCPEMNAASVGWCAHCQSGMAFGHPIKYKRLVTALEGTPIVPDKLKCAGCREKSKVDGSCCGITFAHNKAYISFVSGRIARGEVVDPAKIQCAGCKKAAAGKEAFFCSACNKGFVDGLLYNSKEGYEAAKNADAILKKAVAAGAKCEDCAVGMVTDGTCTHCKVTFKDGEATKS